MLIELEVVVKEKLREYVTSTSSNMTVTKVEYSNTVSIG